MAIAMIPARIGSQRLEMKNLAMINGAPMVSYAIKSALESNKFSRVVVNSDSEIFSDIAEQYGAEFYLRPKSLGGSAVKADDVVNDFLYQYEDEVLAWVNPVSPLISSDEIRGVVEYFYEVGCDSLITSEAKYSHCRLSGQPLNYDPNELFSQTQDLTPVEFLVYSVMVWKRSTFLSEMSERGSAIFCGEFCTYPVSKLSSYFVKIEEDLRFVSYMLDSKKKDEWRLEYHDSVKHMLHSS